MQVDLDALKALLAKAEVPQQGRMFCTSITARVPILVTHKRRRSCCVLLGAEALSFMEKQETKNCKVYGARRTARPYFRVGRCGFWLAPLNT
jgi:hypothetical protein